MSRQKTSNASSVFWAIPPLVAIVAMALFVITKAYFANFQPPRPAPALSPHKSVTIHLTGSPFLTLVLGDRFEATFENGFVLNSTTKVEQITEEWICELDTYGEAGPERLAAYYYVKAKDLKPMFSFGIDQNKKVYSADLRIHRPNVTIKDLKTGKTQKLYDSLETLDEVVAYFKSLPE